MHVKFSFKKIIISIVIAIIIDVLYLRAPTQRCLENNFEYCYATIPELLKGLFTEPMGLLLLIFTIIVVYLIYSVVQSWKKLKHELNSIGKKHKKKSKTKTKKHK